VSDIGGNTVRAQEKIGLVMKSRRKLMAMSSWSERRRSRKAGLLKGRLQSSKKAQD
jgi:hypothetical protein